MQFVKTKQDCQNLLEIVADTARILLESGAETYRVEDTAFRMSASIQMVNKINVFVSYTCIIICLSFDFGDLVTMRRTIPKATNLWKIHEINNFSRNFVKDKYTLQESIDIIKKIDTRNVNKYMHIIGAALASGLFSNLLVGGIIEPVLAFIISLLEMVVYRFFQMKENPQFVTTYITVAFTTLLSLLTIKLFSACDIKLNLDSIIIGCIMPFVPGVSITNSVRDVLSGDLLSGISSMINAIITALSIALGVGSILYFAVLMEAL
ncbi:threonine/serine exporter ThrE family protein [uncultured Finegoldia sp.]|uniref:threonine/serine ThrE exporter family protein n=1 Tax=uncultured Finegoldia sp. TaxID=328009 RepID=UPI0026331768|nr:threonine/serine exporter family protein [uncultured Finegoldia sp.]